MIKEQLQNLVDEGMSTYQIAEIFGKSQTTIFYWLKKYEIQTSRTKLRIAQMDTGYFCTVCKTKDSTKFYPSYNTECKPCFDQRSNSRNRKWKRQATEYKGGKCEKCGYDKCIEALEFHHINKEDKSKQFRNKSNQLFEKTKDELDKCSMLCSNCHREEHYRKMDH